MQLVNYQLFSQSIIWKYFVTMFKLIHICSSNINEIHDGIGNKLSITAQLTAKGCIGLIIAFVHGWKMTLVMLSILTIILIMFMIGSMIFGKVFFQELQAFERAGTIAEEVLSSVRTVLAFNGIEHEQTR